MIYNCVVYVVYVIIIFRIWGLDLIDLGCIVWLEIWIDVYWVVVVVVVVGVEFLIVVNINVGFGCFGRLDYVVL